MNLLFPELKCPICENKFNLKERQVMTLIECGHNICKQCLIDGLILICPIDSKVLIKKENCILNSKINALIEELMNNEKICSMIESYEYLTEYCSKFHYIVEKIHVNTQIIQEKYKIFCNKIKQFNEAYNIKKCNCKGRPKPLSEVNTINNKVKEIKEKIENIYNTWYKKIETFLDEICENISIEDNSIETLKDMEELLILEEEAIISQTKSIEKDLHIFIEEINKKINEVNKITITSRKKTLIYTKGTKLLTSANLFKNKKYFKKEGIGNNFPNVSEFTLGKEKSENSSKNENNLKTNECLADISCKDFSIKDFLDSVSSHKGSLKRNNSYKTTNSDSYISNSPTHYSNKDLYSNGLPKDTVVFLKSQLKKEILNCNGYNVGDKGCKVLLQLKIRSNFDGTQPQKCKEIKLSNCNISDNGMNYLSVFLDMERENITAINLSKNYISDYSYGSIINILTKNENISELKLSNNLFSDTAINKIKEFCSSNGRQINLEIE
ncbi:MAG: hypothetical protein MJ252_08620 [archaeon]|nr:hypothetical protein [archaeon]